MFTSYSRASVCESIVCTVTHVIIPPRPLSSLYLPRHRLHPLGCLTPAAAAPTSLHSAAELNELAGSPRIGHAISARGYRVSFESTAGRLAAKIQRGSVESFRDDEHTFPSCQSGNFEKKNARNKNREYRANSRKILRDLSG